MGVIAAAKVCPQPIPMRTCTSDIGVAWPVRGLKDVGWPPAALPPLAGYCLVDKGGIQAFQDVLQVLPGGIGKHFFLGIHSDLFWEWVNSGSTGEADI